MSLDMRNVIHYWLGKGRDFVRCIRVEWTCSDGVTRTSMAALDPRGYCALKWDYDVPPPAVRELALECLLDEGEHHRLEDGELVASLEGWETRAEMDLACDPPLEVAA